MITRRTPYRPGLPVAYHDWLMVISTAGGPTRLALDNVWAAAGDLSGLCLAQMGEESSYGTAYSANDPANLNPLNLRERGGGEEFMAFPSYEACVSEWRARILDPQYAYANAVSIADMITIYAPPSENQTNLYISNVVTRLNRWDVQAGDTPMPDSSISYGQVPYPSVVESHLPGSNPMVQTSGAPDTPDAVVWHRMIGTLLGTDGWFHAGHAATCYGVGCQATDGDGNAGVIYEWIQPRSGWYGESSGPVSSPYGDGLALVNKVGVASVNRVSTAIEISGNYDTPLDEASRSAIVAMTAYWADQHKIPWNEFPAVPGEDRSYVCWHQELTIGSGKICPGPVVMNETPALIDRVARVLKSYQTDAAAVVEPPSYEPSALPDWWEKSLSQVHPSDQHVGRVRYYAIRRNELCTVATSRRSQPDSTSPRSGPTVQIGEKVYTERQVIAADGKRWWLSVDGHFMLASKFSPDIRITPVKATS